MLQCEQNKMGQKENLQMHCEDKFKRTGKFEGADNVIAAIISAAV